MDVNYGFSFLWHVFYVPYLGLVMVPSWRCPPQTATAPSSPFPLGSWVLHSRSLQLWSSLSQTVVLRKRARSPERHHLLFPRQQTLSQLLHPKRASSKMPPL